MKFSARSRRLSSLLAFVGLFTLAVPALAVDIYVGTFNSGEVFKIDSETGTKTVLVQLKNGNSLQQLEDMALGPDGILYIGGLFTGVKRVNTATGLRLPDVGTNICGPEGPSIDADGNVFFNTRQQPCDHSGIWKIAGGTESLATQAVPPYTLFGEGTAILTQGPYAGCIVASDEGGPTRGRIVRSCPPDFGPADFFFFPNGLPVGIAIDSGGDIYVARSAAGYNDIARYDSSGVFKGIFASGFQFVGYMEFD